MNENENNSLKLRKRKTLIERKADAIINKEKK